MLALARKIVAGDQDNGSVESVFEQARQVAVEDEALLVDAGDGLALVTGHCPRQCALPLSQSARRESPRTSLRH